MHGSSFNDEREGPARRKHTRKIRSDAGRESISLGDAATILVGDDNQQIVLTISTGAGNAFATTTAFLSRDQTRVLIAVLEDAIAGEPPPAA